MPTTIPLNHGFVALVDDDLFPELSSHRWCYANGYAHRGVWHPEIQKVIHLSMHREVMRLHGILVPKGCHADHINRDRLDNRIENLRVLTHAESMRNRPLFRTNKSGFRGVWFDRNCRKWRAAIGPHGHRKHLGVFATPEDAAAAYEAERIRLGLLAAS